MSSADRFNLACSAAESFASQAGMICEFTRVSQPTALAEMVDRLNDPKEWNPLYAQIDAVKDELAALRDGPFRFGDLTTATAHEAAWRFASRVVADVWNAVDLPAWSQHLLNKTDKPVLILKERMLDLVNRFRLIRERLERANWPNYEEIVANCRIESARAAKIGSVLYPFSGPRTNEELAAGLVLDMAGKGLNPGGNMTELITRVVLANAGRATVPLQGNAPTGELPVSERNQLWLQWREQGMGIAAIRNKWNNEHPTQKIARGEAGRDLVEKGIARARAVKKSL